MDSIPHDGGCSPIGVLSIWLEFEGISALLLSDFAKPLARFHCSVAFETLRIHGGPYPTAFSLPAYRCSPFFADDAC